MAEKAKKRPGNVPGPWYVDETCIACAACVDAAFECFKLDDDGFAFVSAQPADEDQKADCASAQDACPVQAIGSDG